MNAKATAVVSYILPIGWLIAFLAGDREGAKYHLNQSLVFWLAELLINAVMVLVARVLGVIPLLGPLVAGLLGGIIGILMLILWIIGLIHAINDDARPIPVIGAIEILK